MMEIINYKDAKDQGLKFYFTGKPCKKGHICERYVTSFGCVECVKQNSAKRHEAFRDEINEQHRQRYQENIEVERERNRQKYLRDKAAQNKRTKSWSDANKDRHRFLTERWRLENPGKHSAYVAKRRAMRIKATPKWANENLLKQIYVEKAKLSLDYEVDHIIPLINDLVCGLHNEFNIRIITKEENRKKNNKFDPDTYSHEDYKSFWDELQERSNDHQPII